MSEKKINYEELSEGMELPEVKSDPITRVQLVDYASASGDYNLLHFDESFAKKTGLKGCIAHGMLQMAINENYIITFKCKILKKYQEDDEKLIEISVLTETQEKRITTQGSAIISFNT